MVIYAAMILQSHMYSRVGSILHLQSQTAVCSIELSASDLLYVLGPWTDCSHGSCILWMCYKEISVKHRKLKHLYLVSTDEFGNSKFRSVSPLCRILWRRDGRQSSGKEFVDGSGGRVVAEAGGSALVSAGGRPRGSGEDGD
ncbi:hypothetical protein HPP92_013194 [Vanilla planifolia]|uniref:Uncharacterized protein n=1 Tax=Vanilla planifolia TaxID=51239 RepID=A0A835QR88_VANPL|nr:hypothetical protein HPP92_013194 [Vanilla planifolia]